MSWRVFGETFVTLFVIMDPLGNAPVFVSLTRGAEPRRRRISALQAVGVAGALIMGFALFGQLILDYLRISLDSLTIAGGLLLLLVALEMLQGAHDDAGEVRDNVALVPLATPLLAGPGAIATVMVLVRQNPAASGRTAVFSGIAAVVVLVGVALLLAERISRSVRPAVVHFLTRVFGLLLSAIAVQLVVDGVRAVVETGA